MTRADPPTWLRSFPPSGHSEILPLSSHDAIFSE
jgi:hypothetical protein